MPYTSYLRHRKRRIRSARSSARKPRASRAKRPSRFVGARTPRRYRKTRRMARAIASNAEIEVTGDRKDGITPSIWSGTNNTSKYQINFNLGNKDITGQTTLPLGMLNMDISPSVSFINNPLYPAPGEQEFVATPGAVLKNYRFVKRNTTLFQVKMGLSGSTPSQQAAQSPVTFQFLILKPRMQDLINTPMPSSHLWIDEKGKVTGFTNKPDGTAAPQLNNLDMKTYLLNKKKFIVCKKQSFTLMPPKAIINAIALPGPGEEIQTAMTNGKVFPNEKTLRYDNIVNKKLYYGDVRGRDIHPKNVNDDLFVVILASNPQGLRASNWALDLHTTTSYTDM